MCLNADKLVNGTTKPVESGVEKKILNKVQLNYQPTAFFGVQRYTPTKRKILKYFLIVMFISLLIKTQHLRIIWKIESSFSVVFITHIFDAPFSYLVE